MQQVTKWLENIAGKKLVCPREAAAQERRAYSLLYPGGMSTRELSAGRVRVVVFRDEKGVKTSLFDSQVHCEAEEGEPASTRSLCDLRMRSGEKLDQSTSSVGAAPSSCSAGWRGRRANLTRRPSSDSELLGEMMFGSMPMKVVGNTVRVHYIRSTDQLMLTKVFCLQRRPMASCSLTDFSESCPLPGELSSQVIENSLGPIPKINSFGFHVGGPGQTTSPQSSESLPMSKARSSSLNVPVSLPPSHPPRPSSALSSHGTRSRSPSPRSHSPTSSVSSLSVPGQQCCSSVARRIQRSRSTSLENASELYRKVLKPLDQMASTRKGRKYGIGVIICLSELHQDEIKHFKNFFFSHFTLIDAHLERLKEGIEDAHQARNFMPGVAKAYEFFLNNFLALYRAPRIKSPVWLSLVSEEQRRRAVCVQFMEELASVIVELDTKETKFFFSTLLSAVLSQHLAWVYTVSRDNSRQNKSGPKSLTVLANSHPYNPLWAQLGDLFGAITSPLRITRTVVTGQQASVVMRLLYVLTYFIRCSEVQPSPPSMLNTSSESIPNLDNGEHDCLSDAESGRAHQSQSHSESQDWPGFEEAEQCLESRASSVTVISESERHSFASPVNVGRDTPVVKPHPFSFKSSRSRLNSQSDTDPLDPCLHRSSSSAEPSSLKHKSGSLKSTRSLDMSHLHSLKKSSPLVVATGGQVTSHVTCDHTPTARIQPQASYPCARGSRCHHSLGSHSTWNDSRVSEDVPSHCDTHYKVSKQSCATLASCESMGFCPLADGFIQFDPSRRYSAETSQPPRNGSSGSLSDLSHSGNPLSRNTSSNSLGLQTSLGSLPLSTPGRTNLYSANNRLVCGSMDSDSGYDQSMSSFTESSKESCTTDSLMLSSSCAQTYCNPECSVLSLQNLTLEPGTCGSTATLRDRERRGGESTEKKTAGLATSCSIDEYSNTATAGSMRNESLSDSSSTTWAPNHSFDGSNTTMACTASTSTSESQSDNVFTEGDITPMTRRRSGAFSFKNRKSWTCEDRSNFVERHLPPNSQSQAHVSSGTDPENTQSEFRSSPHRQCDSPQDISKRSSQASSPSESNLDLNRRVFPDSRNGLKRGYQLPRIVRQATQDAEPVLLSGAMRASSRDVTPDRLSSDDPSHLGVPMRRRRHSTDSSEPDDEGSSVNVEESLSPRNISYLRNNRSLLEQRLQAYERSFTDGMPVTLDQFMDFTEVKIPSLDEFCLDSVDSEAHPDQGEEDQTMADFGHSLLVGHSPQYLSDFVLHGTSEPAQHFQKKLERDLANIVKHSIIDERIEHGVAIVADTDTWSVRLVAVSQSIQTSDVVVSSSPAQPSRYVKQLLGSVKGLWEMRMPPEFCLSHLEDRLLELNEQGMLLATTLMEYGSEADITRVLPSTIEGLNIHSTDVPLLLALAGVHCSDPDLSAKVNYIFLQSLFKRQLI